MTNIERAAQFGAFKALSGHEDALHEEARLTDQKIELDEYAKDELNGRINFLADQIDEDVEVSITYFVADDKKSGGAYQTVSGILSKIKEFEKQLVVDGIEVPIEDIIAIEGEEFDGI